MKKLVIIFFFSLLSLAQGSKYAKIDSLMNYLFEKNKFMGQVSIREKGIQVFKKGYGYIDATKKSKSDGNSKYRIGSVTKTFTSVMVMQLVDEGKIKLSDKLTKFFPKIQNSDKIIVEHLLHQRTGILDFVNTDTIFHSKLTNRVEHDEILERMTTYKSDFEPDSQHKYSNSNHFLLGKIIEKITKKTFAENLKSRIVDKINLKNTYYTTKPTATEYAEVLSYMFNGSSWEVLPVSDLNLPFSSGGITSTAQDLTIFIENLFKGNLVSKSSLEKMKTMKNGYGMALVNFPFGERKFYGHNGKIDGFYSSVGYYPEDDMAISLITNGENFKYNEVMIGILSIYYSMPYRFPDFVQLDKKELEQYLGVYASSQIPLKITISEKNGQLIGQGTDQPSFQLDYASKDTFIFSAAKVEIFFKENGMELRQAGQKIEFTKEK